jgi:hypothetical protein
MPLRTKDLILYAGEMNLDVECFLKSHVYAERVRSDFVAGVQNGVYGTPGLFMNGVRYDRSWDRDSLTRLLEA